MPVKHEKHEKDTEETGGVQSTELTKDHRTWKDNVTNTDVLKRTGQRRLQDIVGERRFRFAGLVLRMTPERPAHSAIDWIPVDGRKRRGRPRKTWRSTFCDDLHARSQLERGGGTSG